MSIPEQHFRNLLAERDALAKQVAELQDRLAQALKVHACLKTERDEYKNALEVCARERLVPFGQEEVEDLKRNGLPFEQVVREIEEMVASDQSGA